MHVRLLTTLIKSHPARSKAVARTKDHGYEEQKSDIYTHAWYGYDGYDR
jgi:hypothetical protein